MGPKWHICSHLCGLKFMTFFHDLRISENVTLKYQKNIFNLKKH